MANDIVTPKPEIVWPGHNYKTCGCPHCRDRFGMEVLTDAVKSLDMTDKQILTACRPKPLYYTNTYGKRLARPCILCGDTVMGTFADLESHALKVDLS